MRGIQTIFYFHMDCVVQRCCDEEYAYDGGDNVKVAIRAAMVDSVDLGSEGSSES